MDFKVVEPVTVEPVTLAEARLQCKIAVEDGTEEDTLISAWVTAAREIAEHYTGRALAVQTLEGALDAFPCCDRIELTKPPVSTIISIKYTDAAGAEQTLATDQYSLSTYDARTVSLTYGASWPSTRCVRDAVRVRFVCGHGAEGGLALPKTVTSALLLMVAWFYEHRGDEMDPNDIQPPAAKALLDTVKLWAR